MKGDGVAVVVLAVLAPLAVLAGCSSHQTARTDIISAGQVDIQLPPGWTVTRHGVSAPAVAAPTAQNAAGVPPGGATGTTIPLVKQDPTTAFFQATSDFTSCLKGLGVSFIGAPDPKNPKSPANDPTYIKNLSTCAAQSHILQALKDFQSAQNNMTPAQIQQENKGYLAWRSCMIGRGWQIPEPKPDAQGRLFSISASGGGNTPQLTPPPGQDALTSNDIRECAAQSQQQTGSGG
jgi:hypothetical protein